MGLGGNDLLLHMGLASNDLLLHMGLATVLILLYMGLATGLFFFFSSSCFMSICNPLGYDRLAPCIKKKVKNYEWIEDIGGGKKMQWNVSLVTVV